MKRLSAVTVGLIGMAAYTGGCRADTITDWDAKATAVASFAALGQREVAIVDLAMFDAVNSIERHYQPYLRQVPILEPASMDAAAAGAAATALALLHPQAANDFKAALAEYSSHISASPAAIEAGIRLGETVAKNIFESRAEDGATDVDPYRPKTRPGQYVPTATMVGSTWPVMRPFVLSSPSQFRPGPPPALQSREWATDYNEIRELGGKTSSKRSAAQTETARFWLMVGPQAYHPLARQMVIERHLDLVDSARFMALFAVTLTDAYIAVFDAKYHYEFWRPVTAIRNGDLDGNPATPPDATWQPLDATPMHPEYPCAHCILSGAARVVLESLADGRPMPEFSLTSPTAPGVTHRWSNLDDFTSEVANARIWAGFHYRFSTRVGTNLGRQVAQYELLKAMQPVAQSANLPTLEPTVVEVDLSALPSNEKAALARIIHAARKLDTLFIRQTWPGTAALLRERTPSRNGQVRAELDALNFFKGPWDNDGKAFIPGVPATKPIADFYPAAANKNTLQAWLDTLSPSERTRALRAFTAIRSGSGGRFEVEPYGRYYASDLRSAADDLRAAAALTNEPTLKRYLVARAEALLDDDYYASDVAFVGLRGPIDVVLGPYEVDDDNWFGVKTSFQASIALVNKSATEHVAQIASHLQELEDHLPLAAELRGRRLAAAAPVVILDAIYHGGLTGAGHAQAGYGLPNDLRVLKAVGARTGTYSNILERRYQRTFLPIATTALAAPDLAALRFEDIRDEIMMVRMFDSLGPQLVTGTKQPIADALRENWGVALQVRSMLLSLWGHRYLIEHGYLDARDAAPLYAAFLVPALARLRGGLNSPSSQGSTYVLNRLIEAGAIHANPEEHLTIDAERADAEVVRAANEFISAMAKGDADSVHALLHQNVMMHPKLQPVFEHMGPAPPLDRIIYRTADNLDAPEGRN